MTDWQVVGAGFTGATVARCLADAGYNVTVFERRNHVAGNAFDSPFTHFYGPHIFHTNSDRVVAFLSRFTEWRDYEHRVVAEVQGVGRVPMPVNLSTIEAVFPGDLGELISAKLIEEYGEGTQTPIARLRASQDLIVRQAGADIYRTFFEGYTTKMWGIDPELLSPGVTARVPIRTSRDDRYFTDKFQRMPAGGYRALFDSMLDHPRISLVLGHVWRRPSWSGTGNVVFTGPADELYDFDHGDLYYRSIVFDVTHSGEPKGMPYAATTNFPEPGNPFTRETEMGLLTGSGINHQVRERPVTHEPGVTEPYYPVPTLSENVAHSQYVTRAREDGIILAGRLADYKYYNMDQATARAIVVARQITGGVE